MLGQHGRRRAGDVLGAAKAGSQAFTVNTAYYAEALQKEYSNTGLSQLLTNHGLTVSNIAPIFSWFRHIL
jgi:hypothetical protein